MEGEEIEAKAKVRITVKRKLSSQRVCFEFRTSFLMNQYLIRNETSLEEAHSDPSGGEMLEMKLLSRRRRRIHIWAHSLHQSLFRQGLIGGGGDALGSTKYKISN